MIRNGRAVRIPSGRLSPCVHLPARLGHVLRFGKPRPSPRWPWSSPRSTAARSGRFTAGYPLPGAAVIAIALSTIALLTAVNCFGVFLSGVVQDVFSFIKVAAIGAVIGICFTGAGQLLSFRRALLAGGMGVGTVLRWGRPYAIRSSPTAHGRRHLCRRGGAQPEEKSSLSLFIGIAGVLLLYAGANSAYLYQLPVDAIKEFELDRRGRHEGGRGRHRRGAHLGRGDG